MFNNSFNVLVVNALRFFNRLISGIYLIFAPQNKVGKKVC